MSYTGYIVWFIALAVAVLALLAVGTLVMADVVHLHLHHHADHGSADETPAGEQEHDTHHHWWHRAA